MNPDPVAFVREFVKILQVVAPSLIFPSERRKAQGPRLIDVQPPGGRTWLKRQQGSNR